MLLAVSCCTLFASIAVPATFKVTLKSQEVEEGNCVTLCCELSKKGVPVRWKREAQVLSEEIFRGKYQMMRGGKMARMTILNVQPEDAGKYSCITGDEKTTAEVKVKGMFAKTDKMSYFSLLYVFPVQLQKLLYGYIAFL